MGLDLLDVTFRIERELHVEVSRDEFFGLLRDRDIVVGELYELILKKLHLRDVGRNNVRLNAFLWSQIQSAIHLATDVPLERIELGSRLETHFPRESRRARWDALREVCPYKIRELDYSNAVRLAGFALAVGVVAIEQF